MTYQTREAAERYFDKWLELLESGKYKQGHEGYYYEEMTQCYCAVGLFWKAEDILRKRKSRVEQEEFHELPRGFHTLKFQYSGRSEVLCEILFDLNDVKRLSFQEIAAWLRKRREKIVDSFVQQ